VIQGVIVLFDRNTGSPLATIDAASVTAIRTAAASAAATEALAQQNAKSLAIIGSGVQAKSHIEAMMQVRAIETVRIYSRNSNSASQLAKETRALFGIECDVETSPQNAAAGAEIICTVTSSRDPVIYAEWLAPGCHLNLVGAHSPDMREVDTATIQRASVFLEDTEMALKEAGDIAIPIAEGELKLDQIKGDIAEVYLGNKIGRSSRSEITLYKSLGNAIQDITAAHALYKSVT
jgi:ornithine cyclodeaminase